MAKKPAKKSVEKEVSVPTANDSFDISNDDRTISFNLHMNGKDHGKIESTVCELHRMMLLSQQEAFNVRSNEDYVPYYAKNLTAKFNTFVSEPAAYKIACIISELFVEQKKS